MSRRVTDCPEVRRFRAVFAEFSAVLQEGPSLTGPKLLRRLEVLLPALINACVELPELHSGMIPRLPLHKDTEFRWPKGSKEPQLRLENLDPYGLSQQHFDPYEFGYDGPVTYSLSMDLRDVFWDLYYSEETWETADATMRRYIVYHWRASYGIHWGHHALTAMRAVHSLLHWRSVEDPDMEALFISQDVPKNAAWLEKNLLMTKRVP